MRTRLRSPGRTEWPTLTSAHLRQGEAGLERIRVAVPGYDRDTDYELLRGITGTLRARPKCPVRKFHNLRFEVLA